MTRALRIATRASEVALRRARAVQAMLAARKVESELIPLRAWGDAHFEEWVSAAGARTSFTKELEASLLKKRTDVAVHALPDVSTDPAPGLEIAAVVPRDDPRDALVLNAVILAASLEDLPRGTRIGTSSVHRRALLLALHPQIEVAHLRGDLPTRLRKVDEGQVHGTIVPVASLQLLEASQRIAAILDQTHWLPCPAQGAVALQARADDVKTLEAIAPLNDSRTRLDTTAERALLASLEGGLQSPLGALVVESGGTRFLRAVIADMQGRRLLRGERPMDDLSPELAGIRLANELRTAGASDVLDEMRAAVRIPAPQPDS